MVSLYLFLSLLFTLAWHSTVVQSDDDEDVKGPIMMKNKDGSLMTTKEQIEGHGYKGETHTVPTEDGYLLTVARITPAKVPVPAVLLQHGIHGSSDTWVTDKDALGYKLSDAGYDVWLMNSRGNCYSRNHTKLDPDKDKSFWDFSFHEIGTKDVPAVIDYVLNTTGQTNLHYVAYCAGTTAGFILTSQRPEYNKKLRSFIALAPVVYTSKATEMLGPDGMAEEMTNQYMEKFKANDKWEVFPRKDCQHNNKTQVTCDDVEENFRDMCKDNMEMAEEKLGGAYFPTGTSLKNVQHCHQVATSGTIRQFKYDTPEENEKVYGSKEPPGYAEHLKNITTPTILWSSEHDGGIMPEDIDKLKPLLGNLTADKRIPDECFDHITFAYARKVACVPVRVKLYQNIIDEIKKLD